MPTEVKHYLINRTQPGITHGPTQLIALPSAKDTSWFQGLNSVKWGKLCFGQNWLPKRSKQEWETSTGNTFLMSFSATLGPLGTSLIILGSTQNTWHQVRFLSTQITLLHWACEWTTQKWIWSEYRGVRGVTVVERLALSLTPGTGEFLCGTCIWLIGVQIDLRSKCKCVWLFVSTRHPVMSECRLPLTMTPLRDKALL